MSRWFRHYAGMMRDEKLVAAAVRSKQPVERVVWVYGAILESAAEINDDGHYRLDLAEVAYFLRADEADLLSIVQELEKLDRVHDGRVAKWSDRQFRSDTSAERQKRFRENRRRQDSHNTDEQHDSDDGVTSPSRHGDAPETETETELDTEKKEIRAVAEATRPDADQAFDEFWDAYPSRGDAANPKKPAKDRFLKIVRLGTDPATIIAAAKRYAAIEREAGRIRTDKVAQAITWLNQHRWQDYAENAPADSPALSGYYAAATSAELEAWDRYRKRTEGRTFPRDSKGGWRVPAQWPPDVHPETQGQH